MERYDYIVAMKEDIREAISDWNNWNGADAQVTPGTLAENRDRLEQMLYDNLFVDDGVTGNASGSYFFNAWKAEEAISHNFDLLGEALTEFGCDHSYIMEKGAEACDVTIRCYLLGQALSDVLDEIED